jgi:hypothetical protein
MAIGRAIPIVFVSLVEFRLMNSPTGKQGPPNLAGRFT